MTEHTDLIEQIAAGVETMDEPDDIADVPVPTGTLDALPDPEPPSLVDILDSRLKALEAAVMAQQRSQAEGLTVGIAHLQEYLADQLKAALVTGINAFQAAQAEGLSNGLLDAARAQSRITPYSVDIAVIGSTGFPMTFHVEHHTFEGFVAAYQALMPVLKTCTAPGLAVPHA